MTFLSKLFSIFKSKKNVVKKNTEQLETLYSAAIIYYKKKDYLNSRKYFQKALLLDPQNGKIIKNLQITNKKLQLQIEKNKTKKAKDLTESKQEADTSSNNQNSFNLNDDIFIPEKKREKSFYFKTLRIDSDASNEEINIRLNAEFRKWRTKVNSPNIKKRYEAEEMLAIISQAKRKLIK